MFGKYIQNYEKENVPKTHLTESCKKLHGERLDLSSKLARFWAH